MKNKKIYITIVIAVVLIGGSFYGGTLYSNGKAATRGGNMAGFTGGQVGGGTRNGGATNGAGIVNGEILSMDASSITVKLRDGGSQIVLFSATTPVTKSVSGSSSDLSVGTQVTIIGKTNTDKSVTAESIQIRPETTPKQ